MIKDFFKKYWYQLLIVIIIAFGAFLRLKGFVANPSLWHDECALGWNIKFKSYIELFGHLRFLQVAPPLFMVATKFLINLFNASNNPNLFDFITKIIPFTCGTLSIFVFYQICKSVFTTKKTIALALFLFAINATLINYSFEFKQYGSDMFCILLVILFFIKLNLSKINYKNLILASAGFSLLIWFSFTTVFFIGAGFINLLLKRKNIKKILILFLPIFISILLYLKFYLLGTYHDNSKGMLGFWANEFVLPNLSNLLYLLVENIKYFFHPAKCVLFFIVLMIGGIFIFFKEKKYEFINIILLAFLFLIIASTMHFYPFAKRLILFLIPIFILLLTKPLDRVNFSNRIKSFFVLLMLICILLPQLFATFHYLKIKRLNKGEFPREMMEYMIHNLKPTDIIFVNKASNIDYYYYSSFYSFKNQAIIERMTDKPDKEYLDFLNSLPKGNYWFFLPYDSSRLKVIGYLKNWTKENTKIIYKNEASQSVLIYLKK